MSLIGIPIGFYGYVFPGNINLMVVELYRSKRYKFLLFALALILFFESVYCICALVFLSHLKNNAKIYDIIELASFILIALMGLWMFLERNQTKHVSHRNTIYRGIFSTIVHPQQIPFWLIAGVLINKFIHLHDDYFMLFNFVIFNALGTMLAMVFYMFFGNKLFNFLKLNIAQINKIMGVVYVLMALRFLLMQF